MYIIIDNEYFSLYDGNNKHEGYIIDSLEEVSDIQTADVNANVSVEYNNYHGYITSVLLKTDFDVSTIIKDGSPSKYYKIHIKCDTDDKNQHWRLNRFSVTDYTIENMESESHDIKLIDVVKACISPVK